MENLLIVRGISGAGKSTFVEKVRTQIPSLVHGSADFIHMDKGTYRFDPEKLGEGHGLCFRTVVHAMQERASMVCVDNTHTQIWELAPYVLAGQAYGYRVSLVRLLIDPTTAAARNVHGVPPKSVNAMAERFQNPLPFWPKEHSFTNPTQEDVDGFLAGLGG